MRTLATVFRPLNPTDDADVDRTLTAGDPRPVNLPSPTLTPDAPWSPWSSDASPSSSSSSSSLDDASSSSAQPPSSEARYASLGLLGRGGMGEVRLCRDDRVGRDVAVKMSLRAGGSTRARFLREARVQGQLEHPAIVPVYDLDVLDDGSAYFAMKRVRGKTLGQVLRDDALPLRRILGAFAQVCLAVDFAHTKGVVHRDIKPGNIMLGDFGEVYLLDWGLAKIAGHDDLVVALPTSPTSQSAPSTLTAAGSMLGTPGYMAPEQIDDTIAPIGPPTDVYALGAVLFEIVAREPYIVAADSLEATVKTLSGSVEPRPSLRAPARAIPAQLDAICARALQREPPDRFASARELHDAVDAFLAGEDAIERRREMSRMHVASADRAVTANDRSRALAELGRAVAVDPENGAARTALLTLLTAAPPQMPPVVARRIDEDRFAHQRLIAKFTALTTLPILAFAPIAWLVGIKHAAPFVVSMAFVVANLLYNVFVIQRGKRISLPAQYAILAMLLLSHVGFARVAGPLAVVPALLVALAAARQTHPDVSHRRAVTALTCLAYCACVVIELLWPQYVVVDGGVLVKEDVLRLDGWPALFFLHAAALATIVTPAFFLSRTRDALAAAEQKLHMQRWQLEQLLTT